MLNLQYKMFLLNQIDQIVNKQSYKHLQYKMFLLNKAKSTIIKSIINILQYKMFLLNIFIPIFQLSHSHFTIQNVPIKLFYDKLKNLSLVFYNTKCSY